MPKDFAKRVSEGLKLSHRAKRILKLERKVVDEALALYATGLFDNKKSFGQACFALTKATAK